MIEVDFHSHMFVVQDQGRLELKVVLPGRQRYTTMEMKTVLSTISRSFTVESLDGRDKVLPLMLITLHPSIPIRLKMRLRKTQKITV
ncbi:hypothetical protein TNIN_181371 [Trichonephila inaurata madagascariensis]|uniref:Uncharacterized protein n=1 Tax=Trichonephila inaurata madagascariensis TaxID=2747483 RepID=A0A8X6YR20_9ARAC|nr:hypothetical protein TNIN_181371 [Trichonephila inaurata madagascariensis]